MSQIANLVAFDGASTPVSHTLVAMSVTRESGVTTAIWREKLTGVPEYAQVSTTQTMRTQKSGTYEISQRTEVPVMESISGNNSAGYTAAPKVAYVNTMKTIGYFSPRSDISGRRLVRQLHLNILGNVSTSVAPATAGPCPEAFDQLISPT